ncbi:MAG: hypothetical protein HY679_09580, partial [Chloroflexi bacterium]|nr:hypothetical protein [Chloroflexota bacterium]
MKKNLNTHLIVWGAALALIALVAVGCSAAATPAPATAAPTAPPAPPATTPPEPQLTGDPVRGGLLYDTWWEVIDSEKGHSEAMEGMSEPTTDHPLWKTQTTNTRTGPDTWRCKECHGWDYKGVDGAYGGGSHKTGFAGIA